MVDSEQRNSLKVCLKYDAYFVDKVPRGYVRLVLIEGMTLPEGSIIRAFLEVDVPIEEVSNVRYPDKNTANDT